MAWGGVVVSWSARDSEAVGWVGQVSRLSNRNFCLILSRFVSFRSWWVILREAGYLFPPAHPLVNFHVGAHPPRPFPDGRTLWTLQEEY